MPYTQQPGRGPINKYGALKQKGLIGDNESLHHRAKRLYGGRTFKEKINPFDRQSARKREYKREQIKKGNFNAKDSLRMMMKLGGYLLGATQVGKKMQKIAENA